MDATGLAHSALNRKICKTYACHRRLKVLWVTLDPGRVPVDGHAVPLNALVNKEGTGVVGSVGSVGDVRNDVVLLSFGGFGSGCSTENCYESWNKEEEAYIVGRDVWYWCVIRSIKVRREVRREVRKRMGWRGKSDYILRAMGLSIC